MNSRKQEEGEYYIRFDQTIDKGLAINEEEISTKSREILKGFQHNTDKKRGFYFLIMRHFGFLQNNACA